MLVACGPYTPSDSLSFDPLLDLISVIVRDRPDVCVLVTQNKMKHRRGSVGVIIRLVLKPPPPPTLRNTYLDLLMLSVHERAQLEGRREGGGV